MHIRPSILLAVAGTSVLASAHAEPDPLEVPEKRAFGTTGPTVSSFGVASPSGVGGASASASFSHVASPSGFIGSSATRYTLPNIPSSSSSLAILSFAGSSTHAPSLPGPGGSTGPAAPSTSYHPPTGVTANTTMPASTGTPTAHSNNAAVARGPVPVAVVAGLMLFGL